MLPVSAAAELEAVFAPGGLLAGVVADYAPRAEQLAMAEAVREAMAKLTNLVVEAGTGTGKTFAYLVPALLSGRRVAVSTGTRALQDQLYLRDLPTLARALGLPVRVAMLKGRANYLCRYRLAQAGPRTDAEAAQLAQIREWALTTQAGDIAGAGDVPEDALVWSRVTSTADNCLGTRCPEYEGCFVALARRRASAAQLVVVNHHLLLADLALRDGGFGELLPDVDVVVVDEAHQVPEVAAQQFGQSLSSAQLAAWLQDVQEEAIAAALIEETTEQATNVGECLHNLRALFGAPGRSAWSATPVAAARVAALRDAVQAALEVLEPWAEVHPGVEAVRRRGLDAVQFLQDYLAPATSEELLWVDVHRSSFSLHRTPIEAAQMLGAALTGRPCSWIFTSATLAVEQRFEHFLERVGLPDAATLQLDSPFDYERRALLYLPEGLPAPSESHHTLEICERALALIDANPGGTFMLFTSHRALRTARDWLDGRTDRLLLAQGTAPRTTLLARFRADGRAVLLGTSSFWEGVDVRGPALSLVIIDKLPFASPGEPLLKARLDWLESQGRSGFNEQLLPAAVIALKQGVGRLIRDHTDAGVLMLCDPRLRRRGYGQRFLRSLPPMPVTSDPAAATAFLRQTHGLQPAPGTVFDAPTPGSR
jgi:ATP-dependent DNA helicase DinG